MEYDYSTGQTRSIPTPAVPGAMPTPSCAREKLIAGAPRLLLAAEAFILSRDDEDAMKHSKLTELINAVAACKGT